MINVIITNKYLLFNADNLIVDLTVQPSVDVPLHFIVDLSLHFTLQTRPE